MEIAKPKRTKPRIIIHGGAGNITRQNLPREAYEAYRNALLDVLAKANDKLHSTSAAALDVSTYAVSLLENNALFNAGHGAVYTRNGTHELEASVMVSTGFRKRGVGVMKVTRARNPILLAREMLLRGELEDGGGAQGHSQLEGQTCDRLAKEWGLEIVKPSYFWTKKRWDEHRRGIGLGHSKEEYEKDKEHADTGSCGEKIEPNQEDDFETDELSWDGHTYLPQGTVGAVVLDSFGTVAVATSTGGLTNKLPGRIGDTPTIGAGFFADQWQVPCPGHVSCQTAASPLSHLSNLFVDCLPTFSGFSSLSADESDGMVCLGAGTTRAVAMSGTGNGDSFLRLSAVRTAAAMAQFMRNDQVSMPNTADKTLLSLQRAVSAVAGPHGTLQRSAGDRWGRTGEGEGGIIGIDVIDGRGSVVYDFNCGGMFRAWIDDDEKAAMMVFKDEF